MSSSNTNATTFVTGASRGIGLALAEKLLSDGHRVATFSRSLSPELKALSEKYSSAIFVIRGDISDADASAKAVASAATHFGGLDSVILNSGLGTPGTVRKASLKEWRECFDVNFFGMIPILQTALPILEKSTRGARIVLVSSVGGVHPSGGLTPYTTSKATVNALARSLRVEEPNITTIAVSPGLVETEMVKNLMTEAKDVISSDLLDAFHIGIAALNDPAIAAKALVVATTPEVSGGRLAWLAINAPKELSGRYLDVGDLNDPEIAALLKDA